VISQRDNEKGERVTECSGFSYERPLLLPMLKLPPGTDTITMPEGPAVKAEVTDGLFDVSGLVDVVVCCEGLGIVLGVGVVSEEPGKSLK
jgi:hypothetical protein